MDFALKIIFKSKIENLDISTRVENEIAIQMKLDHPNILKMHAWFQDNEKVYLILEYAYKGDLFNVIDKHIDQKVAATVFFKI